MHKTLSIELTVYQASDMHPPEVPQMAVAGRSNVGKSSLLNRLAGRKQLAKTSSTPGKTQSINFYKVEPGGYYLVDLPGYGYAKRSKTDREKWARLIQTYLTDNPWLRAVLVLIDCRLDPQASDLELTAYLKERKIPVLAALTKADKCSKREGQARLSQWQDILGGVPPLLFSAVTGQGVEAVWDQVDSLLWQDPENG
jgi:GTP-binding protein